MKFTDDDETFNLIDRALVALTYHARTMQKNPDCFDTSRPEALRFEADLFDFRCSLQSLQYKYLASRQWTALPDETIIGIVRYGERDAP